MLVSSLLLFLASLGRVQASSVFSLSPSEDVVQNVECPIGCQDFRGNVSAVGGNIDFYVTDPSGNTVLRHDNISFIRFEVSTPQNGTYAIHLANRLSASNVTATLFCGRNVCIVVTETVTTTQGMISTNTTTPPTSTPAIPLIELLTAFLTILGWFLKPFLGEWIRRKHQKYEDGESKTPVVA